MTSVTVCLCTYKRDHVIETLNSIARQKLPPAVQMEIVVVDNDKQESARSEIAEWATGIGIHLRYDVEPEQNIALARNRTLRMSNGDWLAFIDDDEVAAPDWLTQLLGAAERYDADIVMGSVLPTYPAATPDWIPESGVFERPLPPTGTVVKEARTSNALVRARKIVELQRPHAFLPSFGLTGGSDFELFHHLQNLGAKMISCREAIVTEEVEVNRINMDYLKRRAIRGGECYIRVVEADMRPSRRSWILLTSVMKATFFLMQRISYGIFARKKLVKSKIKLWQQVGKIRLCLGQQPIQIYRKPNV